jgi:hypothetical protein
MIWIISSLLNPALRARVDQVKSKLELQLNSSSARYDRVLMQTGPKPGDKDEDCTATDWEHRQSIDHDL